jgi:hypothetical protein
MTSAGFSCNTPPHLLGSRTPLRTDGDSFLPSQIVEEQGAASSAVRAGVPGGPIRQCLELSDRIQDRIRSDLDRLLDRRVVLRPRASDLLGHSRVVTVRQVCMDLRRSLQAYTQTEVRVSIHGSVASRILSGQQPLLQEGSDLDVQFEIDATRSSFAGLPPGNQLYQSTEALLEVVSSHCPNSPAHRDLFSHFFANRVAIQPVGEESDGWSLYSVNMVSAEQTDATSANYDLDLVIIWRGLRRPYLLSLDSFSILLEGPLLHEFQATTFFPDPHQALLDLQQGILRVDQPDEVRRGLLGRLLKMMSRGHALPEGPPGRELVQLLVDLAAREEAAALPHLLSLSRDGDSLSHLRMVWHLLQIFPREADWQNLPIWQGAADGQWAPPRSVLRQLPEGSFRGLWILAAKMERREWLNLAAIWARAPAHPRLAAAAASSSSCSIKGFADLGGGPCLESVLEEVLCKRSLEIDGWLTSLLEEQRTLSATAEERAPLLAAWDQLRERSGSSERLRCALLLLLLDHPQHAPDSTERNAFELYAELLAELAYQEADPKLFQALVRRSVFRSCLANMEWKSWGQYLPEVRLLKWVEAMSTTFPGEVLWVLEHRKGADGNARQLAGLRALLLKGCLHHEPRLRSWMRLFGDQATELELQTILEVARSLDGDLERGVLQMLRHRLELSPNGCSRLAPSTCVAFLQTCLEGGTPVSSRLLIEILTRFQCLPQHLTAVLPSVGRAFAQQLDDATSLVGAHLQLIERLLEDAASRHSPASGCAVPRSGSISRAWDLATGEQRIQLLRVLRRFRVPLPVEACRTHSLWCGQQSLWREAGEAWSTMLEAGAAAESLPWTLCTLEGGLSVTEPLWRLSIEQTGGCLDAWLVLPAWAEAMGSGGHRAVEAARALSEALPLAERQGATSALLRNCVRLALLSPGSKLEAACGRLAEWFCRCDRLWQEEEAPLSLQVLAEVRHLLQQHRRERALEVCWKKFLEHPVQEGLDQLTWPFLAAAAMQAHVPRVFKSLAPQLAPRIVRAVEWLARTDMNSLSQEMLPKTAAARPRQSESTSSEAAVGETAIGETAISEAAISEAAISVSILWKGLLMPGLMAMLKYWPSDQEGFVNLQRVLSELSVCAQTPEAAGAATWIRLLAIGHQLLDRGVPVAEEVLSLWSVTQPTFADPEELVQTVFDHVPSLIKHGNKALEQAVLLFSRLGRPPQQWHDAWIRTFAMLVKATRGQPAQTGFLLAALPVPLSPTLCRGLPERERLEAARAIESLPLKMDWIELEGLHVLHRLLQGLPLPAGCAKHRLQLTQVAVALMLRAEAPDPRLPVSQVQVWIRVCLELAPIPEWTSQSITVLSQAIQVSSSAGHSPRMLLESCSSLWEGPTHSTLEAEQWVQLLLAFVCCVQWKAPDPALISLLRRGLDSMLESELKRAHSELFLDHVHALETSVLSLLQHCPPKSRSLPALQDVALRMGSLLVALGYSRSLRTGLALWEALIPDCIAHRPAETLPAIMRAVEQLSYHLPEDTKETSPFILAAFIQVITSLCGASEPRLAPFVHEIQNLLSNRSTYAFAPLVLLCHALPWAISQSICHSDEGLRELERLALLIQPAWARAREALQKPAAPAPISRLVGTTLERMARLVTLADPKDRLRFVPLLAAALSCIQPDDAPDLKTQCWRALLHAFSHLSEAEQVEIADALQRETHMPSVLEDLEFAASSGSATFSPTEP